MLLNLIGGIASSIVAVVLIEAYWLARRRYDKRSLRTVLGSTKSMVVVPAFPGDADANTLSLLSTHDAYAMAHVLEAFRRIGGSPNFCSISRLPESIQGDLVCLGGDYVNSLTASYLSRYCPGFTKFVPAVEAGTSSMSAYRCGHHTFLDMPNVTWAFVVRLAPETTGLANAILLLWGQGAVGTAAAGLYVAEHAKQLGQFGKRSFFVAVAVQRQLGYRAIARQPIDLSPEAFADPPPREAPLFQAAKDALQ